MRALSVRQANRCETAKTPHCRCRCGGALHGIERAPEPDQGFFEALAAEDPHHIDDAETKKQKRRTKRNAQRIPTQISLPWESA